MERKIELVMLVDDNPHDNFFHELALLEYDKSLKIIKMLNALLALEYLSKHHKDPDMLPDIIFLDINMPYMTGWEFLEEYNKLKEESKKIVMVVMLSTSDNPDDINRIKSLNIISDYKTKPLTSSMAKEIISKHF